MTSVEFVKNKLNTLLEYNPQIRCVYEYNEFELTHYVIIYPKEFYDINNFLFTGEETILDEFISLYPYEGLVFLTDEDEIELSNPIFDKKGYLFDLYILSLQYNFADLEIFNEFVPELDENFLEITYNFNQSVISNLLENLSFSFKKSKTNLESINYNLIEPNNKNELAGNHDKHPLAA